MDDQNEKAPAKKEAKKHTTEKAEPVLKKDNTAHLLEDLVQKSIWKQETYVATLENFLR
jgi:hypothetical protein